jgi:hypothetical protein
VARHQEERPICDTRALRRCEEPHLTAVLPPPLLRGASPAGNPQARAPRPRAAVSCILKHLGSTISILFHMLNYVTRSNCTFRLQFVSLAGNEKHRTQTPNVDAFDH